MVFKKLLGLRSTKKKDYGPEKRDFVRLVYPPDKRPVLTVDGHSFEVINISRNGLKFLNHMGRSFGTQIIGKVTFPNRGSIKINGRIKWEGGGEIGLFTTNIPPFIIKQEIRSFIRKEANDETVLLDSARLEAAKEELVLD